MKDYDEVRGLRHNSDKLRYDLIPPIANREYAKVWTQALGKYPEGNWEKGHIYDPKSGKEYKCTITAKDKNTLNVRGYIGISVIGRTDVWTRVK